MIFKRWKTPKAKSKEEPDELTKKVIQVLKNLYDPEIPVNIYDLGLIYYLEVSAEGAVDIQMTMTSPNCPVIDTLPGWVRNSVEYLPEIKACEVEVIWDPPWSRDMLSDAAKLDLGIL